MRRREFLGGLGATVARPLTAAAQQTGKIYRTGLLSGGPPTGAPDERNKSFTSVLAQRRD